jgi:hypothetical protein
MYTAYIPGTVRDKVVRESRGTPRQKTTTEILDLMRLSPE